MGMDDRLYVLAGAVDPKVETGGWVGHARPRQSVEISVDFDEILRRGFVETQPEPQSPLGPLPLRAGTDLTRQSCFLAGHGQNSAGIG